MLQTIDAFLLRGMQQLVFFLNRNRENTHLRVCHFLICLMVLIAITLLLAILAILDLSGGIKLLIISAGFVIGLYAIHMVDVLNVLCGEKTAAAQLEKLPKERLSALRFFLFTTVWNIAFLIGVVREYFADVVIGTMIGSSFVLIELLIWYLMSCTQPRKTE